MALLCVCVCAVPPHTLMKMPSLSPTMTQVGPDDPRSCADASAAPGFGKLTAIRAVSGRALLTRAQASALTWSL